MRSFCLLSERPGYTATLQEMQRVGPGALGMMSLVLAIHLTTMFGGQWAWNRLMPAKVDTDTVLVASGRERTFLVLTHGPN